MDVLRRRRFGHALRRPAGQPHGHRGLPGHCGPGPVAVSYTHLYGDELTDYDGPDGYGDEDDDGPPWDEEDDDGEEAEK